MERKIQEWIGTQIINHLEWMAIGAAVLLLSAGWSIWTLFRLFWHHYFT